MPEPAVQGYGDTPETGICNLGTSDPLSKHGRYTDRLYGWYTMGNPELHLLSGTLLQISGLQGQALGRSLASLVVARKQLWLSQVRVPDADKASLLDGPISPGHTFGPSVEEILQSSHRERKASLQVATLLPSRVPARGRSSQPQSPQACTITKMVPVPTALLGDLRQCLQATVAAGNRALPQGKGNAGHGQGDRMAKPRWLNTAESRPCNQHTAPRQPIDEHSTADCNDGTRWPHGSTLGQDGSLTRNFLSGQSSAS
ncbi:UNVERIFIED_CONTAM: hypothetical protein FKN15_005067 [Acipenser sinensis]